MPCRRPPPSALHPIYACSWMRRSGHGSSSRSCDAGTPVRRHAAQSPTGSMHGSYVYRRSQQGYAPPSVPPRLSQALRCRPGVQWLSRPPSPPADARAGSWRRSAAHQVACWPAGSARSGQGLTSDPTCPSALTCTHAQTFSSPKAVYASLYSTWNLKTCSRATRLHGVKAAHHAGAVGEG